MAHTIDTIKNRTSANNFDSSATLSDKQIQELVAITQEIPTSFNMQNWRIIAVRTPEKKEQLKAAAYGQAKVGDAAVTFVIVGITDGYKELSRLWQPLVDAGGIDDNSRNGLVNMANGMYADNPQNQRDEAIRSASMAAMTLMLTAQEKGLASGPMIGYDPAQVSQVVGLGENEIPAMLIAVGPAAEGNWPRKPRRALDEQLEII